MINKFTFPLILICNSLLSQLSPKSINFTNIEPDWTYISKDTNFVQSTQDPYSSPYSNRYPYSIKEYRNKIILFENTYSQNIYLGPAGVLVHQLDKETGNLIWIHHWNEFVGLKHREDYNYFNLRVRDEDNFLHLGSCRDVDTINYTRPALFFECLPSIRKIDLESGILVEQKFNTQEDLLKGYATVSRVMVNSNQDAFFITRDTANTDTALVNKVIIQSLDSNINYEIGRTLILFDTTTIPEEIPSRNFNPFYLQLDANTIAVFFGDNEINDLKNSPKRLNFVLVDITDKNNIYVKKQKNITDLIKYPQSNGYVDVLNMETGFVFGQNLVDELNNRYYYLRWFSKQGELLVKTDKLIVNGKSYLYALAIGEFEKDLYLFGLTRENGLWQHDLIKIDHNSGIASLVKALKYVNQPQMDVRTTLYSHIDKTGNIYCCFECTVPQNDLTTKYLEYIKFSAQSLGITNTIDEVVDHNEIKIRPNPASNELTILADDALDGTIKIYNYTGQNVLEFDTNNLNSGQTINISTLPIGMYHFQYVPRFTTKYKFLKFIKI
jgi:Secretion system C-terminal sorting domain